MNAEVFAEWLRRQGKRVVRTSSSYWFDASPWIYQAFPYHWLIQPSEEELTGFLRSNRAIGLRYSAPVDHPLGHISYHVVYDAPQYTIDLLERRTRQNVRSGLSHCRVELVPFERLAGDGWELEIDTLRRHGRHMRISREAWRRRYLSAADLPGFDAWGALIGDRLAASLLTFQVDDCCEMISQQCHRDFLQARVNHALVFAVTQALMSRAGVSSIFYSLESLNAPPSTDEFKFRMGYVTKQVRQRVEFHPSLAPAICRICNAAVRGLVRSHPKSTDLQKAAGMFHFWVEGRHPLMEQVWPPCLSRGNRAAADI